MTDHKDRQITVERLTLYLPKDAAEIGELMPDLNPNYSSLPVNGTWLKNVIDSPYHDEIIAKYNNKIVGAATLSIIMEPIAGQIGYLEAFVVSHAMRGQGVSDLIWKEIELWCRDKNARLEFTSSPNKVAAHKFYLKHGAKIRSTSVFRYKPNKKLTTLNESKPVHFIHAKLNKKVGVTKPIEGLV